MTALDVYFHSERVGSLERQQNARLRFSYDEAWVTRGRSPLSLSLPLRSEPFSDEECRPFFSGLLPEGDFLKAIARAFSISAENPFTVLHEIGGECAGAISLTEPGAAPPFRQAGPLRWLRGDELARLLKELPTRPLLVGPDEDEGIRLSLSGTRNKLPVLARDGELGITRGRPPSTHIVKKPDLDFRDMVANEAYCLALSARSELSTARARPLQAGEQEALLVTRYDRRVVRDEVEVERIHQEDFCQALGVMPEVKYESEGGPGIAVCGELLRRYAAAPAVDLLQFLDALIFNLLIRNTDAHGKNYSLLLEGDGSPRLAPLYDLLSAGVYGPPYGRKMAMKYGGEYRPRYLRGRHLRGLADSLSLPMRTIRSRAAAVSERLLAARPAARDDLPDAWRERQIVEEIDQLLLETTEGLKRALDEED